MSDLFKPGDVVKKVQLGLGGPTKLSGNRQIPWFTTNRHVQRFKHYKVRPPSGDSHPEATRSEYCIYDSTHKDYLYTQAWIDLLIAESKPLLANPAAEDSGTPVLL